jgi:hypothetical protein
MDCTDCEFWLVGLWNHYWWSWNSKLMVVHIRVVPLLATRHQVKFNSTVIKLFRVATWRTSYQQNYWKYVQHYLVYLCRELQNENGKTWINHCGSPKWGAVWNRHALYLVQTIRPLNLGYFVHYSFWNFADEDKVCWEVIPYPLVNTSSYRCFWKAWCYLP